ncbi:MAG: hypothetical protein EOO46_21420 [Flavobacterium sp.]|nr:MAG: hypothetical protein EOO46_21420 [Flavobacterium sp.]
MNYRLRNDEVVTGATFLKTNFLKDRKEIELKLPEFDTKFESDFLSQIVVVQKLDRKYAKTQEQIKASQKLYDYSGQVNTGLNTLSFQFKGVGLSTELIATIKNKIHKLDIEGAHDGLKDLASFTEDNLEILASKGIKPEYPATLVDKAEELLKLNEAQNSLMDQGEKLSTANQKEYNKLRKMISHILGAGKIVFAEEKRRDFYLMSKLVSRMRSGNEGGKEEQE